MPARPLVGLLFLVTACAAVMKWPTPEEVARIHPGRWTQQNVLELLGLPNRIATGVLDDGSPSDVWAFATVPYTSAIDAPLVFIPGDDPDEDWPGEDAVIVTFSADKLVYSVQTPW